MLTILFNFTLIFKSFLLAYKNRIFILKENKTLNFTLQKYKAWDNQILYYCKAYKANFIDNLDKVNSNLGYYLLTGPINISANHVRMLCMCVAYIKIISW